MIQIIEDLLAIEELDWFLDSNVLLGGQAKTIAESGRSIRLIAEVIEEVRKRPEHKAANRLVSKILENSGLVCDESFIGVDRLDSYEFLKLCAKTLSPLARVALYETICDRTPASENQALQNAANAGTFFETPKWIRGLIDLGYASVDEATISKATMRSWFRYPAKRRKAMENGSYKYTDELLIATGVANSLLLDRRTVVVSDDTDLGAIMKQVTDNVLWAASKIDCHISLSEPTREQIEILFNQRCLDFDRHRNFVAVTRMRTALESLPQPVELLAPNTGEVLLLRPTSGEVGQFVFSPQFAGFLRDIKEIQDRLTTLRA